MIKVSLNKEETEIEENTTIGKFLKDKGNTKAAVWINGKQLLKAEYDSHLINDGDEIKVLRIIAGG